MISRTRRRIRLRKTAPPSVFLMLNPKRLAGRWLARQNTVKFELDRRFPPRYTASNSPRRTSRASRGKPSPAALFRREAMASLLAARRQDFAAANRFHAGAEPMGLGPAASPRLIGTLWQSNPLSYAQPMQSVGLEFPSLCEAHQGVKETLEGCATAAEARLASENRQ